MREGVTVSEASEWIQAATPVLSVESVPVFDALGRVLAEPVVSARRLPPADCSAMDGYAVRCGDLAGATAEAPVELAVAFEVAAGAQPERAVGPGEAARIFTGAPVPPGADTVVRQEDTEALGDRVRIRVAPPVHEHVRDAGEDIDAGDRVLPAGTRVSPAVVGVLASLGRSVIAVHRQPRVAILSGGDELVPIDGDVSGGRIVSSNSYTLAAQCRAIGFVPVDLGIADDRPESVERQFRAALHADCIVSSAGVSVGDHDHVRPVLEKLGCRLEFWGVRMKPGYPLAFGRFDGLATGRFDAADPGRLHAAGEPGGPLVFGLPGNPVSAAVTFELFVRPALLRMLGHRRCFRPRLRARLEEPLTKRAGRLHFVRVGLEERDGTWVARSTGSQSSGVMTSMTRADGLLVFPLEATALQAGDEVDVLVLDDAFFARDTPGF